MTERELQDFKIKLAAERSARETGDSYHAVGADKPPEPMGLAKMLDKQSLRANGYYAPQPSVPAFYWHRYCPCCGQPQGGYYGPYQWPTYPVTYCNAGGLN